MNSKDPSPGIYSQLLIDDDDDDDDEWENELNRERDEVLTCFRNVSSSQKNSIEFALETLNENPWLLQHFPDAIRENETVVLTVVEQKPEAFQWASPNLRGNKGFAIQCALLSGEILEHCSDNLKSDRDVVSAAVSNFGKALQWAHISLRNDKAIVIEALSNSNYAAEWIGDTLAADRKFIQLAAKICSIIISYASVDIQSDREFLFELITQSGCDYSAIPDQFKTDLGIALEAFRHDKSPLGYLSLPKNLLANMEFVRRAIKIDGDIYNYATDDIRADESLFKDALRNLRDFKLPLLRSAPTNIRANKALVLLALQFEWRNIEYAVDSLKSDPEVVLAAIRTDDSPRSELHHAMHYASDILKNDMAFVKKAVEINWMSFSSASIVLKESVEFVGELLSISENVIQFASESVCSALGVPFPVPPHVSANRGLHFNRSICCETCGYENGFLFEKLPTAPFYDFDNNFLLNFRSELRWCNDCNGLKKTEITYCAEERQRELAAIASKGVSNAVLIAVKKWANQERAPRCLNCGSQDLSSMTERRLNATEDGPTMWRHSTCGGRFVVKSDNEGFHFGRGRPTDHTKYSPDGFPYRDLRNEFDKEFPQLSGQVFDLVASEAKYLTMHPNLGLISATMELDNTHPELSAAIRKFVREHLGIPEPIGSAVSHLKSEFPELYLMFRHEARRLIEAARMSNANFGGNAAIHLIEHSPPDNEVFKASAPMEHHNSSLHLNPFRVLGANTRDSGKVILEKAEELALHFNSEQCQKARSDLTNPRSRVGSEVSWLPGVSPRMAEKLVTDLPGKPIEVASQTGLPELARANLMCSALELVDAASVAPINMAHFMLTFGELADQIDIKAVLRDINEDRTVAGFPEVRDISLIEEELDQRKRHYKVVLKNTLNKMPSAGLVEAMTILVNESTGEGEHAGPPLIDDLVDSYEVETQGFLAKEKDNIQKLIKAALAAAPTGRSAVDPVLEKIEKVVKNWAFVGKPIQVCMKSRGLEHRHSLQVGQELRGLVFELIEKHQMISQSHRISKLLVQTFGDLPEFQEKVQEDVLALEKIGKRAVL